MSYWTENLCSNPSFEVDLSGYTALSGTLLSRDTTQGFAGHASLLVTTDGSVAGEGFTGPAATAPSTGTGSISLYVMGGTGIQLTVSAVIENGATATIAASTNVLLAGGDYQRVILSGLPVVSGNQIWVLVQTTTAQPLNFWVDAVQYEMNSPAHAYIDGSFLTCQWEGTPHESASFQPYQFGTAATGGMWLDGHASPVTQGEVFTTSAEGTMSLTGTEGGTSVVNPYGAMTDFGIWTPADMDPAVSYPGYSNALASTGQTAWARFYGMFMAPQDYVASGGQVLWKRAAYAAVGLWFKSMPANNQQSVADVQFELAPVTPVSSPAPTSWVPPRNVATVIKPTRLNFCPNPSIEVSTAGWTAIGSATLARDNSITPASGTYSLKVTVNAAGDGCYIVIPDLILGDTYIASASTQGGPGLQDILMSVSGSSASSAEQGIPYGGNAILGIGFGQGPYGGIEAGGTDMPTGQWFDPSVVFTASASSVVLAFTSLAGTDISYPAEFWVDAVLVEAGEMVKPFFDGDWGTDYSWESGGTPGLTRSYYYERQAVATGAVSGVLSQHTPLGIGAAAPVFSAPYTQ